MLNFGASKPRVGGAPPGSAPVLSDIRSIEHKLRLNVKFEMCTGRFKRNFNAMKTAIATNDISGFYRRALASYLSLWIGNQLYV